MDKRVSILDVLCDERDGEVVRSVKEADLSVENLRRYYERLKDFDVLFDDFYRGDVDKFIQTFVGQDQDGNPIAKGLIWEVDDVGILYLTKFSPMYREAKAHYTFWDGIFRGRADLIRETLKYAFKDLELRIVRAEIPVYVPAAHRFAEEIGFIDGGRKRDAVFYKGQWFDTILYSVVPEEVA